MPILFESSRNFNGTQNLLLGMRYHSDASEWSVMFERFKDETDPGEKNKIMAGLAGIQSIDVLKELVLNLLSLIFKIYFLLKVR